MNRRLNDYLDKKGAKAVDEGILKEYTMPMKETVLEIEREIGKNERRAAEQRFSPRPDSLRQKAVAEKKRKGT